jgi:hypothetical protein
MKDPFLFYRKTKPVLLTAALSGFFLFTAIFSGCARKVSQTDYTELDATGIHPKDGFVPDSTTAIKIAEAVWIPLGGKILKVKSHSLQN